MSDNRQLTGKSDRPQTLFTGQVIARLSKVESTNDHVRALMTQSLLPEGFVAVARHQAAGRGQRGSKWISEPGKNLTFSILFQPVFLRPDEQFYLNKAISLGMVETLRSYTNGDVAIKWPNDILLNNKKVAGMLVENIITATGRWQAIVGIGLNVNQEQFGEDLELATSLLNETGTSFDIEELLFDLCGRIEGYYLRIRANKQALDREYEENLLGLHEWRAFESTGKAFTGRIVGVTELGKLKVELEQGDERAYDLKTISFTPTSSSSY